MSSKVRKCLGVYEPLIISKLDDRVISEDMEKAMIERYQKDSKTGEGGYSIY